MTGLKGQSGAALVLTLLVLALIGIVALGIILQGQTEHIVTLNERDSLKALASAESGLQWARRRIIDASNPSMNPTFPDFSALLRGPNGASTADDNLIGLRDLSLTSTASFTATNEDTASAIVTRDFGDGSKLYEALRLVNGDERALVYVRIDDNYDEGSGANDPLTDIDVRISALVVAEYPVFVDASGDQIATQATRGVAVRRLRATFGRSMASPALLSGGDMTLDSGTLCGECGTAMARDDLTLNCSGVAVCGDATGGGSISPASCASVSGDYSGSRPAIPIPVINPYDDLYVPSPSLFNTASEPEFSSTYALLRCPGSGAGVTDPSAKYFAFVPGGTGNMGRVFKAYWKATSPTRWQWRYIDDLGDSDDTMLDDCGRVVSGTVGGTALAADPGAGSGVIDGDNSSFYGFGLSGGAGGTYTSCAGSDASLCSSCNIARNDFNRTSYYDTSNTLQTLTVAGTNIVLPGSHDPDGTRDFNDSSWLSAPTWVDASNRAYSPLYNGVVFFLGGLSPQLGIGGSFRMSSGLITPPNDIIRTSLIAVGSFYLQSGFTWSAARDSFPYAVIAGRDIRVMGSPSIGKDFCSAGACADPAGNSRYAAILAAHEQIGLQGGTEDFDGMLVAEDASTCSTQVSGDGVVLDSGASPRIHYDCNHPPNPWTSSPASMLGWQEIQ